MSDKHVVFDRHSFANEGVTRNLAALADDGILLDLDKRADLGFVPNFAAIEVNEFREPDVFPQLDVLLRSNSTG